MWWVSLVANSCDESLAIWIGSSPNQCEELNLLENWQLARFGVVCSEKVLIVWTGREQALERVELDYVVISPDLIHVPALVIENAPDTVIACQCSVESLAILLGFYFFSRLLVVIAVRKSASVVISAFTSFDPILAQLRLVLHLVWRWDSYCLAPAIFTWLTCFIFLWSLKEVACISFHVNEINKGNYYYLIVGNMHKQR